MGIQHVHLVEGHFVPAKGAARGSDRWLSLHREPDPTTAIGNLHDAGFSVWVADLADDSEAPETLPLDKPVCIWMGAELEGVSDAARGAADGVLTIPMRGFAQSLNVSVASALAIRPIAERARQLHGVEALLPQAQQDEVWAGWMSREREMRLGIEARNALKPVPT
jgi:tRNA (guanosine-2'-O-)-methyltransferase